MNYLKYLRHGGALRISEGLIYYYSYVSKNNELINGIIPARSVTSLEQRRLHRKSEWVSTVVWLVITFVIGLFVISTVSNGFYLVLLILLLLIIVIFLLYDQYSQQESYTLVLHTNSIERHIVLNKLMPLNVLYELEMSILSHSRNRFFE
jgi:hypothetical protein